jgi:hypothetical protein
LRIEEDINIRNPDKKLETKPSHTIVVILRKEVKKRAGNFCQVIRMPKRVHGIFFARLRYHKCRGITPNFSRRPAVKVAKSGVGVMRGPDEVKVKKKTTINEPRACAMKYFIGSSRYRNSDVWNRRGIKARRLSSSPSHAKNHVELLRSASGDKMSKE